MAREWFAPVACTRCRCLPDRAADVRRAVRAEFAAALLGVAPVSEACARSTGFVAAVVAARVLTGALAGFELDARAERTGLCADATGVAAAWAADFATGAAMRAAACVTGLVAVATAAATGFVVAATG
jgi:hypothetical protein